MSSTLQSKHSAALASFDSVAAQYDSIEAANPILQWMRQRVLHTAFATFQPHSRLLDIGCGTGTDALFFARRGHHVVATEPSTEMLATARRKIARGGCAQRVDFVQLGAELAENLIEIYGKESFDGILSNFGALNCVADLRGFAASSAQLLRSRGMMLLNIMPPICPWEIAYYLLHFEAREALRRWRGRVKNGGLTVRFGKRYVQTYYHSSGDLRRIFSERFEVMWQFGLGVLVPPPYLSPRGKTFKRLCYWDERVSKWPVLRGTGDHMVMILRRK